MASNLVRNVCVRAAQRLLARSGTRAISETARANLSFNPKLSNPEILYRSMIPTSTSSSSQNMSKIQGIQKLRRCIATSKEYKQYPRSVNLKEPDKFFVNLGKFFGATMWFWVLWRFSHDGVDPEANTQLKDSHMYKKEVDIKVDEEKNEVTEIVITRTLRDEWKH